MEYIKLNLLNMIYNQVKKGRYSNYLSTSSGDVGKIYAWSNENITGFLKEVDFSHIFSALVVLAGGDFLFSLLTLGVKNIDCFDLNKVTEYYTLGLKKALILKYNYEEFMSIFPKLFSEDISLEELTTVLADLLPTMDYKYREFWHEVINYNYQLQKNSSQTFNLMHLISYNGCEFLKMKPYMADVDSYARLKSNLVNANIEFMASDISQLPQHFSKKYDLLYFSNILDYVFKPHNSWSYADFQDFIKPFENLLKEEGMAFWHYVYLYQIKGEKSDNFLIKDAYFGEEELTEEMLMSFPSAVEDAPNTLDAMILKRGQK